MSHENGLELTTIFHPKNINYDKEEVAQLQPLMQTGRELGEEPCRQRDEVVPQDQVGRQSEPGDAQNTESSQHSQKFGVMHQLGIYYAMGFALIFQGIFSMCYHICPTNLTLQYDTTLMYVMCTLGMVKTYQVQICMPVIYGGFPQFFLGNNFWGGYQ